MTTDVENQDPQYKEEGQEVDSEEVETEAQPEAPHHDDVKHMDSVDIRDPHVAVHGKKIEADKEDGEEEEEDGLPMLNKMMKMLGLFAKYGAAILLVVYLLAAFIIDFNRATALFVITVLVVVYNIYAFWAKNNEDKMDKAEDAMVAFMAKTDTDYKYAAGFTGVLVGIMVIIMAVVVRDGRNLLSLFGMLVFLTLTWLFSWKPSKVQVRPVIGSIFIQFIFGFIVIRTTWGLSAMEFLSDIFTTLLGYTVAGSSFVFDWLTNGRLYGVSFVLADDQGTFMLPPPFFFSVLPTVIFFSALMSVGYYIRALPWLVRKFGYVLGILLGTSASESLSAAGNIFIGQTEAPLLVRVSLFIASMQLENSLA